MAPQFAAIHGRRPRLLFETSPMFLWFCLPLIFLVVYKGHWLAERKVERDMAATTGSESGPRPHHPEDPITRATPIVETPESAHKDEGAEDEVTIVCPTYIPKNPATLATLLHFCDLHHTLGAAVYSSPAAPTFLDYIDTQSPSTSLYDIFDKSPLPSCQKTYSLSSLVEEDNDQYVQRYRSPGAYQYRHTAPPSDYQVYVLRKQLCLRDMILWFSGHKMKNGGQVLKSGLLAEDKGNNERTTRKTSLMLDLLIQAGAVVSDNEMRAMYGQWLLPHIEAAKRWEKEQMEACRKKKKKYAMNQDGSGSDNHNSGGWLSGWSPITIEFSWPGGRDKAHGHEIHEQYASKAEEACLLEQYGSQDHVRAFWDKYQAQGGLGREAVCRVARDIDMTCSGSGSREEGQFFLHRLHR
ncbi:hypothetical protein F4782DRAFT_535120 [Xylaria castorea]|nr:hypothetical protein F4782DRAFT_535120 [Xylaria castorea]